MGGKVKEHVLHIITKSTAREVYESIKVSSDSSNSDSSLEEFMMRFRANIIVDDTTSGVTRGKNSIGVERKYELAT